MNFGRNNDRKSHDSKLIVFIDLSLANGGLNHAQNISLILWKLVEQNANLPSISSAFICVLLPEEINNLPANGLQILTLDREYFQTLKE